MNEVGRVANVLTSAHPRAPHINYAAIAPFEVLLGGAVLVLLVGLLRSRVVREQVVPLAAGSASPSGSGTTTSRWSPVPCASTT
jgi:hypothetical protein